MRLITRRYGIYVVADEIRAIFENLGKFVKVPVIKAALDVTLVNFKNRVNQVDIMVGLVTKQCLKRLLDEGYISDNQYKKFFEAVRASIQGRIQK